MWLYHIMIDILLLWVVPSPVGLSHELTFHTSTCSRALHMRSRTYGSMPGHLDFTLHQIKWKYQTQIYEHIFTWNIRYKKICSYQVSIHMYKHGTYDISYMCIGPESIKEIQDTFTPCPHLLDIL